VNGKWGWVVGLAAGLIIALLLIFRFNPKPEKTPQDYKIDTLLADQQHLKDSMLAAMDSVAHERDSVMRLSDSRGDSIEESRARQRVLSDSLTKLIGALPTYTYDSATCNLALRLSLAEKGEVTEQRDICARDRDDLRQQIASDSTEFRQAIARLIFNIDTLTDAVWYERQKPRPCRVDLLIVKPKCGPALASTGILGLLIGLLN
jgi:hypothetical protein